LDSNQVDILALQEINEFHTEQLSSALKGHYPYDWYYLPAGLAIYSRHPILSREIHSAQPWPIQSAIIQVQGEQIQVINAHLAKPGILLFLETRDFGVIRDLAAARIDQIDRIKEIYHENGMPSIITCDCNATNLTAAYAQLATGLDDVFRERGWGLGHTFLIPRGFDIRVNINLGFQRIDYIFHSPEIEVAQVRVVSSDSKSDHRPVWAQFELNP
jgi:vancomycin resistance protein VanJ